ncbi:SPT3 Dosage dependent suppressor of Ty-induced promoter mutations-like protein [Lobosporangium transversale]|uniref:IPT/TIG domain-containing protein n=1 Tax=Lobosporangium transversale TaxID=64571 RepID=A0A1Y2GKQ5_9FUNG|nr:hypothetical protein BCR41DRAFT_422777 [Lobosporangium transversale]KAF9901433.1 SPT3 Dosage dependent suppressor of Ty-induced promoter mutations-like protein [Lobosporangium transversale]ORZ13885.1 hypothetical protein BCR41DRAFT_422777 [Lobosporangium transversale]|eukprot:XP_021880669.1 hypothetical protein BCR41DRAFT_422777 [Lobosporangium transversale]
MPPYTAVASIPRHLALGQNGSSDPSSPQQCESPFDTQMDHLKYAQFSASETLKVGMERAFDPISKYRLNVKTHVFKKEQQEYVPTRSDERLRIETIVYAEISIVDQEKGSMVRQYDYLRLPRNLFLALPEKIMYPQDMASKRILSVSAAVMCPSNDWKVEEEACVRCSRRMSAKLEENECRIMHILPELYRTEDGDALVNFRSGVANIQFKINCYCGHKKEKEGFVVRFEALSDSSIASHATTPLMFYHQNKNRMAARALAAAARTQRKAEKLRQQQEYARARSVIKSVSEKSKREPRSRGRPPKNIPAGQSHQAHQLQPHQQHHQLPSPSSSLMSSPGGYSVSPILHDSINHTDGSFPATSLSLSGPMMPLFAEQSHECVANVPQQLLVQQQPIATISHMTPNSGPTRGGTLVTIHGSDFTVGEMMYVCFGEIFVPVIPQHSQMLECFTPAWMRAETVPVFALRSDAPTSLLSQSTFTYVDDNEKELIKLALQRVMTIAAHMEGSLDTVRERANELAAWSDILGTVSSLDGSLDLPTSVSSTFPSTSFNSTQGSPFTNLETMILESLKLTDSSMSRHTDGLSTCTSTGHTMLHLAVILHLEQLVKDLLSRGIDACAKDKNGLTAIDLARLFKNQSMMDILSATKHKQDDEDENNKIHHHNGLDSFDLPRFRHLKLLTITKNRGSGDPHMSLEWTGFDQTKHHTTSSANNAHATPLESREYLVQQRQQQQQQQRSDGAMALASTISDIAQSASTARHIEAGAIASKTIGQNHDQSLHERQQDIYGADKTASPGLAAHGGEAGCNVVVARRGSNDNSRLLDGSTQQAVVQSSRYDVESEPALYLGGQPVVLYHHCPTSSTALSNSRQERENNESFNHIESHAGPSNASKSDDSGLDGEGDDSASV